MFKPVHRRRSFGRKTQIRWAGWMGSSYSLVDASWVDIEQKYTANPPLSSSRIEANVFNGHRKVGADGRCSVCFVWWNMCKAAPFPLFMASQRSPMLLKRKLCIRDALCGIGCTLQKRCTKQHLRIGVYSLCHNVLCIFYLWATQTETIGCCTDFELSCSLV